MSESLIQYGFKVEDIIKAKRTSKYNIEGIKEWLKLMPTIPELSDEQIAVFLIACKNDIEATKSCIVAFFKLQVAAPEFFDNRDVDGEELVGVFNVTNMALLSERTKDNNAVIVAALKDTRYSSFNLDSQVKLIYTMLESSLYYDPPAGLVVVIDIKGVGLMHITRLKLASVKKFFQFLQEALPTQLKEIHILNTSYVFDKIIMILKPFMNKELFDMITTHSPNSDMEEFYEKYIPREIMPADYGGHFPSLEQLTEESKLLLRKLRPYTEACEQQIEVYKENRT